MKVTGIKTHKITAKDKDISRVLGKYIKKLSENSVVAVTSKIVAITEGRIVKIEKSDKGQVTGRTQKDKLIEKEAQYFIPREENPYNVTMTIKNNMLIAGSGIDESNASGNYILWPKDPQKSANAIRGYLSKKFNLKKIGVIITDSKTAPLRWGVTSVAIASSGFEPLKDYVGNRDLFGRRFLYEKLNIADSLAASAGAVMGEGSEQTPIAIISEIPFVKFTGRNPTKKEIENLKFAVDGDLYSPILTRASWRKGKAK